MEKNSEMQQKDANISGVVGMGHGARMEKLFVDKFDHEVMFSKIRHLITLLDSSFRTACSSSHDYFHQKFGRIIVGSGPSCFKTFCKKKLSRLNYLNVVYLDCASADDQELDKFLSDIQDGSMVILDDYSSLFKIDMGAFLQELQEGIQKSMFRKNILILYFVYPENARYFSWTDEVSETVVYQEEMDDVHLLQNLGRDFQISISYDPD